MVFPEQKTPQQDVSNPHCQGIMKILKPLMKPKELARKETEMIPSY